MLLTEKQKDALGEIINIAFARTAASLSQLSGHRVLLDAPGKLRTAFHAVDITLKRAFGAASPAATVSLRVASAVGIALPFGFQDRLYLVSSTYQRAHVERRGWRHDLQIGQWHRGRAI